MKNALQREATHRGFCTDFGKKWDFVWLFLCKGVAERARDMKCKRKNEGSLMTFGNQWTAGKRFHLSHQLHGRQELYGPTLALQPCDFREGMETW